MPQQKGIVKWDTTGEKKSYPSSKWSIYNLSILFIQTSKPFRKRASNANLTPGQAAQSIFFFKIKVACLTLQPSQTPKNPKNPNASINGIFQHHASWLKVSPCAWVFIGFGIPKMTSWVAEPTGLKHMRKSNWIPFPLRISVKIKHI